VLQEFERIRWVANLQRSEKIFQWNPF